MNGRKFVLFLGVLSISLAENKETRDQSDHSHKKGDSYFSQDDESEAEICRKHGDCEVLYGRNGEQIMRANTELTCTLPAGMQLGLLVSY